MKKVLVFLLMLTMILSLYNPMVSHAADDVTGHRYEEEIRKLINLGVLTGYPDGSVQPNRDVTRAEFAKMVVLALELDTSSESSESTTDTATEETFKDVPAASWYAEPVSIAVRAGVVNGYGDNTFRPNDKITREQMASMVSRALETKGIIINVSETPALKFSDSNEILPVHQDDVRILYHLKIMNGNTDNTFRPKQSSKRWMVALVMLGARDQVFPPADLPFQASSVSAEKTTVVKQFQTFEQALEYVKANSNSQIVERNNKVIWMENGIAVTNAFANVFPNSNLAWSNTAPYGQFRPYATSNTEMKYLDSTEEYVKVELAGKAGFVKSDAIKLIPSAMMKGQSYYEVTGTNLVHKLFNHSTEKYASTGVIGKAPKALIAGAKYYSWDGANFTDAYGKPVTEAHQYFNKLPLGTTTNYTAAELDKYLTDAFPYYKKTAYGKYWTASPLAGSGHYFKEIEEEYQVNALYLMAHAIHESAWGTSKIAQDKNNLFGYGAVDSDPYRGAYTYGTFKESIKDAAVKINKNYHNPKGSYYNGSVLGNKAIGMNVRYASDPYWGEKIAGHMYRADSLLGVKDFGQQKIGYTAVNSLRFRAEAGTGKTELYQLPPSSGYPVAITGETTVSGALWFKVLSEDKRYVDAYGYGKGSLGEYIKLLPIAEGR